MIWLILSLLDCTFSLAEAPAHFESPAFQNSQQIDNIKIFEKTYSLVAESVAQEKPSDPNQRMRFRVPLGKLTKEEFVNFNKRFHGPKEQHYDPQRVYEIKEFLPPFLQALEGKRFVGRTAESPRLKFWFDHRKNKEEEVDPASTEISYSTNCWQTVLEFLKGSNESFHVYYPPMEPAANTFFDKRLFSKIKKSELRFGDLIFIFEKNGRSEQVVAVHAAISLTPDLFFEKTGSSSQHLYRMLPLSLIEKDYPKENYQVLFLRPTGRKLPPPESYTVKNTDRDLALELGEPLASEVSVEMAFGQGFLLYTFSGMARGSIRWNSESRSFVPEVY